MHGASESFHGYVRKGNGCGVTMSSWDLDSSKEVKLEW